MAKMKFNRTVSNLSPTGDWEMDCARGKQFAREVVQAMLTDKNPMFLKQQLEQIASAGRWTGIETGFAQALAEELIIANMA